MTIQVAVANSHGLAMASDRHVFRGGEVRSTGQDVKLIRLRGAVPAAMMAAGPFAVLGTPIARLAPRIERALDGAAAEGTPDALAEAVLRVLEQPLAPLATGDASEGDAAVLAEIAEDVLEPALGAGYDARTSLEELLRELERAPFCRGGERMQATGQAAWRARAPALPGIVSKPAVAAALRHEPDLCGRAVIGAMSRDWRKASDVYLSIGCCCPATGVPVLLALRLWRGIGNRLHAASRLERDYEAVVQADRTVLIAQGSGRAAVEAMVDGLAEEHWGRFAAGGHAALQPGMAARWDRAHDRIGVSSGRELAAIAAGLVRGAEVIGYLTGDGESTVAEVDCILLNPRGISEHTLPAGSALRQAA
jgi:hypothetical protein